MTGDAGDIVARLAVAYDQQRSSAAVQKMQMDMRKIADMSRIENAAANRRMMAGLSGGTYLSASSYESAKISRSRALLAMQAQENALRDDAIRDMNREADIEEGLARTGIFRINSERQLLALQRLSTRELHMQHQLQDLTHLGGRGGSNFTRGVSTGNRGSMMILELGRGIEDAAIGFQMQGLSGAFRGAANNAGVLLSQLGKFGPYLMLASSLGVAWWGVSHALGGVGDEAESAAEKTKKLLDALREQFERQEDLRRHISDIRNMSSVSEAQARITDINRGLIGPQSELQRLQELKVQWDEWINATRQDHWLMDQDQLNQYRQEYATLNQRIKELQDQITHGAFDQIEAQRRLNELKEQEAQAAERTRRQEARASGISHIAAIEDELRSARERQAHRRGQQQGGIIGDFLMGGMDAATMRHALSQLEELRRRDAARFNLEDAQNNLRLFQEMNPLAGSRFGDAGIATSLESGSQEAFRAIVTAQQKSQDPLRRIEGYSQRQLAALESQLTQLTELVEHFRNEEVVDE